MPTMDKERLKKNLIDFLKNDPACVDVLQCLNKRAEIQIEIAQTINIQILATPPDISIKEAPSLAPDFIFDATPEAIEWLISEKDLSPAKLAIKLVKQVLSRDIKIQMPSNIFQVTRKGYFKIIALGGSELLSELRQYDLANIGKITAALRKLRK